MIIDPRTWEPAEWEKDIDEMSSDEIVFHVNREIDERDKERMNFKWLKQRP